MNEVLPSQKPVGCHKRARNRAILKDLFRKNTPTPSPPPKKQQNKIKKQQTNKQTLPKNLN